MEARHGGQQTQPATMPAKGAVRKRSQLKTKMQGEEHWTKRSKKSGQFMDQKKSAKAKPFKGVRKDKLSGVAILLLIFI